MHWRADNSRGVTDHETDLLGSCVLCSEYEIALVLTVVIIGDNYDGIGVA